jgi:predicted metalloprotease with PDZ domain
MLLQGSHDRLVFLAKQQPLPKNALLTEVITKESQSDPVGIGLRIANGKIIISSIRDGSLASPTQLMPGMELVSIDNEDCFGANAMIVSKMLRDAVGKITIVASTKNGNLTKSGESNADVSLVTAMLDKTEKDTRVGLTIVRKFNKLIITKISEDGLAAESDLLVGMEVLSINNKDVSDMQSSEAGALLAEAEGTLTILAKRPNLPPGSYVTAAINKESSGASLGIKLGVTRSGEVVVKSVTLGSPASFTELEEGMLIKSINNVDTTKMPPRDVALLLKSPENPITILAQTTTVVAMGRASFTSMRSLTSARSLADDTINSCLSGSQKDWLDSSSHHMKPDLEEISESDETDVTPTPKAPPKTRMVSKVPESPKAIHDTITIVQGGRRTSLTVKNVVDC